MIKVLFFAGLQDLAQTDSIELDATHITGVRSLVTALSQNLPPALIEALADETAMVSVDQHYAGWDAQLEDGVEVAFLPPVSGG